MQEPDGFFKGHALGNDYLVVEPARLGFRLVPGSVRRLCDRHLGVGADGIVSIDHIGVGSGDALTADAVVHNPDGSIAEVSGNGLRIAALALRHRVPGATRVLLRSAGRNYTISFGTEDRVSIELPPAHVLSLREPVEVGGRQVPVTVVDVGNPHAVLEASEVGEAAFPALAKALESARRFPQRTNVEWLRALPAGGIAIAIHERGVGPTAASGTGACASAAAAVALGLVAAGEIRVEMAGGTVVVAVRQGGLTLTGEVVGVASGRLDAALVARLRAEAG